jgi:hypothetical protein
LKRREFFSALRDATRAGLPEQMRGFEHRATMNLLKIHYGANYRVHYEAMISSESGNIEVGLHFEDGPESTGRLLEHFDQYILEIKHGLGETCELERWTKSWGHLFEAYPLEPLTRTYVEQLAGRLAQMIIVLQPILDEAYELELVSREPRPSTGRGRFGRRRRG